MTVELDSFPERIRSMFEQVFVHPRGRLELDSVADLIRSWYPEARVSVDHFDSGASLLSVVYRGRLFNVETRPGEGVGVGEVRDDEGFTLGYDNVVEDRNSAFAVSILANLLNVADRESSMPTHSVEMKAG